MIGSGTRICAGTIVARNYVPAARVLAESFRRHHPDAGFAVLVIDADTDELTGLAHDVPGVRFLGPDDIAIDRAEFGRMALAYTVTELSTAVKPWLLRTLLAEHEVAIYLDPDIEVFGSFATEVGALAVEHEIVLTPHVLEPMPRDGLRPSEADIMASGVFNLGFIGVSRDAAPFLQFWADRLRQDAISSVTEQLFTDQRWVDNVPALFRHTKVVDPGWNVAYWNVYQRPLALEADGTLTASGHPLRFVHFSGYRPEKPWLASTHYADRPRVLLSEYPLFAELAADYRTHLFDAGYLRALDDVPYRWNTLPDGTPVSMSLRRAYRSAWVDAERRGTPAPPNPFGDDTAEELLRWACAPATPDQERAGLSRWSYALWHSREDLRQVYPDPLHADAEGYRHWCRTSGLNERALPAAAVADRPPAEPVAPVTDLGANVLGYLTAELGVGELGRLVHEAVVDSGVPVATAVEEFTVVSRTSHPLPADAVLGDPRYGVSVLVVNADMTGQTLRMHQDLARDRHVIGVWSWELDTFPEAMHPAFSLVDEIWTISDFCAAAIREHSPVPVRTFPVPVRDPLGAGSEQRTPPAGGVTRFLFVFDHNSILDRKNPLAAITAFRTAFGDREDVRLVIKSINGDRHPGDRERLRMAAAGDDRIELIEGYLSAEEVAKLFATADAYVSLHRSEGFGLTVAEAMAHGLPVVATDYGGTAEFLTADTGWPVPYRLVEVGPGNEPYPRDAHWAEPDTDAAAAALREIAADPAAALRRGAAARRHVLATRSAAAAARWVRTRLEEAHGTWLHRRVERERPSPLAPLEHSREALRWRADPAAASKVPMAAALRRGILRVLDHYDHHQRAVLTELMDGVGASMGQLAAGQQDLLARIERLEHTQAGNTEAQREVNAGLADELRELRTGQEALPVEMDRRIGGQADRLGTRIAELEHRIMSLLHERAEWMAGMEATAAELTTEVPRLRTGLLRHHDLVDPAPKGGAVPSQTVITDIGPIRLPAEDTVVLPWLRRYGTWEAAESRLADLLLPAGGVFVDIGAHVGYFTVRGLRRVGAEGAVYAVEPWAPVRELLCRNVTANVPPEVAARLTLVEGAAWDADGPLRLALSAEGNTGDNRIDPTGGVEVPGLRLDGLAGIGDRRVDVVKCDAQGRDQRALAGMTALIEASRPHVLTEFDPDAIEQAGDVPAEVAARYRSWGYQLVPVTDEVVDAAAAGRYRASDVATSDEELVDLARDSADRFVTLWLRPLS
ncbi:FkbM family methyltransferase [Actinophytocola sp. S1-96]|uniref:FkbM family methyltransferase n=2 Tax=Actinophytocola gossypii TaxID=2812003 RepID=A0ABT2JFC6_9PSEU|nr:FkbM family methyltransferase [Actinophytocola gossypii]